jgi:ketosteroid isomerase-like protein
MKNMKIQTTYLLAILFISTSIGAQTEQALSSDELAVTKAMEQLFETYNTGDLDGHIAMFAKDSIELPPNQPTVIGRENIHQRKISSMNRADAVLHARIDELVVSGNWAFVRMTGTGKIVIKDGPTLSPDDKAILIWKRMTDGSWKLTHDIWNSNLPARIP